MNSLSVFFIDDNVKFLETAVNYLDNCPKIKAVAWSLSFKDSIEKINDFKPDYILLDFSMPGMNGIESLRIIKSSPNPPKVIILSLNNDLYYEREAINAGADGFIYKGNFVQQIKRYMRNEDQK